METKKKKKKLATKGDKSYTWHNQVRRVMMVTTSLHNVLSMLYKLWHLIQNLITKEGNILFTC